MNVLTLLLCVLLREDCSALGQAAHELSRVTRGSVSQLALRHFCCEPLSIYLIQIRLNPLPFTVLWQRGNWGNSLALGSMRLLTLHSVPLLLPFVVPLSQREV
jgi:hypothetical protein